MSKFDSNDNKSIYRSTREGLGLTREQASELLESITPERIERIEQGKFTATPDEIMVMAEKYRNPKLCNYYCANECDIGKQFVREIKPEHLSQIVLEMLSSLNSAKKKQERLIDITADGSITEDEIEEFVEIQEQLERISMTVDALKLWVKEKIANGAIDSKLYKEAKLKYNK